MRLFAVLHMDSSGCHAIEDILADMRKHNIQVIVANPSATVMRQMELAGEHFPTVQPLLAPLVHRHSLEGASASIFWWDSSHACFLHAGLPDLIGREFIFVSVHEAHVYCQFRLQEQGYNVSSVKADTFLSR